MDRILHKKNGISSGILLKMLLCGTITTIALMYIMHGLSAYTHVEMRETSTKNCSLVCRDEAAVQDLSKLHSLGLPDDYFQRNFIDDNHFVDKLVSSLKTSKEVIHESQRIQIKMLTTLIGKYKYAMLFNFAAFENKGDPAITVGELEIIGKLGLELIFQCVTSCGLGEIGFAKRLSMKYSAEELVILMQGGGNILAYTFEDYNRKIVLESFPDFKVVMFPQSVWPNATEGETKVYQSAYSKHKHLTFLYRDRNPYDTGKNIFPNVTCYLMPDMAFQIGKIQRFMTPTHDIVWLRRTDKESIKYELPPISEKYDIIVDDWWFWKTPKGSSRLEDSVLMATNGMLLLQRGRVVITDRLHGHILCVLLGMPHVIIDTLNRKVTSYMKSWTGRIENVIVAHSAEDALNKALYLLRKLDKELPKVLISNRSIASL